MRAPFPGRFILILGLALLCTGPSAAAVTGRAVDTAGAPLSGIEVRFGDARATTDTDGHFLLAADHRGMGTLSFHRDGRLLCGREDVASDEALGPVTLDASHRITGRVLAPDGSALPDVTVRCAIELRDSWEEFRLVAATTTDADGAFVFDDCCSGNYRFHVAHSTALTGSHVLPVGGDFNHMILRMRTGGADVRGTITGPAGEPVADVTVAAGCFHSCRSDASGHYRLTGLEPGWTGLLITPPDGLFVACNQSTVSLSLDAVGDNEHSIALVRAGALRVAPTSPGADDQSAPLTIRLRPQGHWQETYTFAEQQPENGAVALDPIAAGTYDIAVRSSDSALLTGTVSVSAGATAGFTGVLPVSTPIVGTVVDGEGRPVSKAQVWGYDNTLFHDSRSTLTDDQGRFELGGFGSNPISLYIDHQDFVRLHRPIDPSQRAVDELRLVMHGLTDCRGTVRDVAGEPVAGARVTASWKDGNSPVTITDAQGGFTLARLPATRVLIHVNDVRFHPLEHEVDLTTNADPLSLSLQPGARIGGQVLDAAGQHVPQAHVHLRGGDGATAGCVADATGRFPVGGLDTATYVVTAIEPHGDELLVRRTDVPAGTLDLILRPDPVDTVRFLVRTGDGTPCPGATIRIEGLASDSGESVRLALLSDAAGAAAAELPRGRIYMARISKAPAPVALLPLDLRNEPDADAQVVPVTLTDGQTLSCTVSGGTGCHLSVADPSGRLTRHHRGIPLTGDPITLAHLPRGLVWLQIHADATGQHLVEEYAVNASSTDAVELALPPCGRLSVKLSARSEVHAIALWDPRRRYTTHSDDDGNAEFALLPAGHYLVCGAPGAADQPRTARVDPDASTGIRLAQRARLRLQGALDPATLGPRSHLHLLHLPTRLTPRQVELLGSVGRQQVRVARNGAFRLVTPPARYHAALLTGDYGREALVRAHGILRANADGLELDLSPQQVRGVVVDATGEPVSGATVHACHRDSPH
ncbi:MAG: carboxypeptidase-like regulatory domain-containing protein, partial [Planctomycetota bacterium]